LFGQPPHFLARPRAASIFIARRGAYLQSGNNFKPCAGVTSAAIGLVSSTREAKFASAPHLGESLLLHSKEFMPKSFACLLLLLMLTCLPGGRAQPLPRVVKPADHLTQSAASKAILAETRRVQTVLAGLNLSGSEQESYAAQLSRVERAAQSGHVYFSLHVLQTVAPILSGYAFQQAQAVSAPGGMPAFEQVWQRLGGELAARQRQLKRPRRLPLAVQAVLERALTQVQPNYQSSRLYAQQTNVANGQFYLGLAQAELDFALFCHGLKFDSAGTPPPVRSLAPDLAALEREVLLAYRQAGASDQQGTFIRLNASLKVAQDLEHERLYRGAWLQTLEVWRALLPVKTKSAGPPSAEALQAESEALRARLTQGHTDHSLGWLYWQMAQAALARGKADDLPPAQVILQQVLPRYFQFQTRSKR
jgi:hypothetical protein